MHKVLYDVNWQVLRVSLLAKNDATYGGFTTVPGVQNNLHKLDMYVNEADEDFYVRVWRVLNLLNATRMGYSGQGKTDSVEDELVKGLRDHLQGYHEPDRVAIHEHKWSWNKVAEELTALRHNNKKAFHQVYDNLSERARKSARHKDITESRKSLLRFLELMGKA